MPETLDELLTRRHPLSPESVDEEARTVRATWSTGAPVLRRDYEGPFLEVLSLQPEHVRMGRLNGAPVLDAHKQWDLRNVIGVVAEAKVNGTEGVAVLRFSRRQEVEPIWQDVRDGIIRGVSIGYTVHRWEEGTDPATGQRVKTAVDWEPREISLVPLPADAGATIRSADMPPEVQTTDDPAPQNDRAGINSEIRSIASIAGLGDEFANELIDQGATVEQARAAAFERMARRDGGPIRTQTVTVGQDYDNPEVRAHWMGEALYSRLDPAHEPSEPARQYVGLTIPELGREVLRLRGISTTGLAPATVITRALHTTSDFAIILGDAVGRTLRAAYQAAPAGVRQLGRQTTVRDFRAKQRIMLGEAPTLQKVNEHGEFTSGSMAEARESYSADTYGRILGISRQALINDDLGAFSDLSRRFGIAAAEFEAQFLVNLLTTTSGAGPTMEDGNTLFHADHGNKAGTPAALSADALSAARKAMRLQTGLSGQPIAVTPKYLLVPAALETEAEKLLASIAPATSDTVNPFAGRLTLVVEPRLDAISATRWYVTADPGQIDGLEYCYLEGAPGPQLETRSGFEVDGVQIKIRLDYGAGFVDWRGWYANDGA